MKKLFSSILVFTMILSLFSACGSTSEDSAVSTASPTTEESVQTQPGNSDPGQIAVSNVDEFLDALGSDMEITLNPGTYNLTTASDYGKPTDTPVYSWEPTYDGYELTIHSLARLTIKSSGKDNTDLVTSPRFSNVLVLDNCSEVNLEGMTAGHTEGGEMCTGGVINLRESSDILIKDMGLYGCGTIGVAAEASENITVLACDIYDCSFSGIRALGTKGLVVEDTMIHDLGNETTTPASAFYVENSRDVQISSCTVSNNQIMTLLDFSGVDNITLKDCSFTGNRTIEGGFRFFGCEPVFDNVSFTNNTIRLWYAAESDTAVDPQGNPIAKESFQPESATETSVTLSDRRQVHASTVDEFLDAIASDTEIILDADLYDLSLAQDYGEAKTETYFWSQEFDGPELVITDVDNFSISSDGDHKAHTISATPRYADVLTFQHCSNITLSGFTAGHTKEPGSCAGGVLYFDDCDNMTVDNCGLFGCGIIGVNANYCSNVDVLNSDIYECSQGGISMYNVSGVNIDNCTFRDLGYFDIDLQRCEDAIVDGSPYTPEY